MGFGVSPFRCLPGCGVVGWARELPWAGENPGRREGDLWKVNGLLRAKRLRFG